MSDQEALMPFEPSLPRRDSGFGPRPGTGADLEIERTDTFYYLRAYWHVLVKRKWTVLTVVTVLTTLVAIVSFKMQPVFEARSRVEVENETPQVQSPHAASSSGISSTSCSPITLCFWASEC